MEKETKLLTDMLSNLQQLDLILGNQDNINESQVAYELQRLNTGLERMANLRNEMGTSSSSEIRIPRGLFAALDKKEQTSLDGFERLLMKEATDRGEAVRQKAKLRQDMEAKLQEHIASSNQR